MKQITIKNHKWFNRLIRRMQIEFFWDGSFIWPGGDGYKIQNQDGQIVFCFFRKTARAERPY